MNVERPFRKGLKSNKYMESAFPGPTPDTSGLLPEIEESQIAALLQSRFGDGMVYLSRHLPVTLLEVAVRCGFVDAEGYLTRRGRMLLSRYDNA